MRGECAHAGAEQWDEYDWCPFCGSLAVDGKWRAPAERALETEERKTLIGQLAYAWNHAELAEACAEDLRSLIAAERAAKGGPLMSAGWTKGQLAEADRDALRDEVARLQRLADGLGESLDETVAQFSALVRDLAAERDDAVHLLAKLRDWTDAAFGVCLFGREECEDGPCADRLRAEELCKGVTP